MITLFVSLNASATHIYGADFFYTWVSGNTYNISLVVYGDCAASNTPVFSALTGATPQVEIYNGSTFITTITLSQQGTAVEVTPVCPSQLGNTKCTNVSNTIPGVKKFTYSANYTLSTSSASWRFLFNGNLSSSSQAGRSSSITNASVGSSIMQLEATLNNTAGSNSSPVYTTIPTPFFCINKAANYNPGAVDANGDVLSYSLVAGLEPGGVVTYTSPYTATAPLAAATGSFSFSTSTGQLAFTPNLVQKSLVVNKVTETRGSTVVGTSMREMTFVVLNNCNNRPPGGYISNNSAGNLSNNNTTITACQSSGVLTFNINPSDSDGDAITVAFSGIPTGATFTVSNNSTTSPTGSFSWNVSNVIPGSYNFFITYTDNGCPLSSKQTQAYTIVILPDPTVAFALVSPATCSKKARFNFTPGGSGSPWSETVYQGTTTIHTITGITGTQLDSLNPGIYTIRAINTNTCYTDTSIIISAPPVITPAATLSRPTCYGGNDGSIIITGGGGLAPFKYALGSGSFGTTNTFPGLTAGTYTFHVKDSNDCIKDTTITLTEPGAISMNVAYTQPPCNYYNSGVITINAINGTSPYQYAVGSGTFSNTNSFSGLFSGTYLIHIKDANGCLKDSNFVLHDSISVHANAAITNVLCNGNSTGAVTLIANSATAPYYYKLGSGSLSTVNSFTNLTANTYNFHIEDVNHCYLDTAIVITEPTPIYSSSVVSNVLCFGQSNGNVTVSGTGGINPYQYALAAGSYGSSGTFSGFAAGTYTFHIMDNNACIHDTSITITQPDILAVSNITGTQPLCNGATNGSYSITLTGGTIPYSYALNSGGFVSNNSFGGLGAGTYIIHVQDANGCSLDTANLILDQPTAVTVAAQLANSTCTPLDNGIVRINAANGTPGYTYAVDAGSYSSSPIFNSLAKGTYVFHTQDSHGCLKDTTITVNDSITVTASAIVTDAKCFNESSGIISAAGGNGVSPYTYALNSGAFSSNGTFNSLKAGTYAIHIKDNLGCAKDTTGINIGQPTIIVPHVILKNISCYGLTDDTVTLSATGGTPGYTYAMGNGSYSPINVFSNYIIGQYLFHIKDSNACVHDTTFYITQPLPLTEKVIVTNALCFGDSSGTVTAMANGGTKPYKYAVNSGAYQSDSLIIGLIAGIHTIHIKDTNGCLKDTLITLTQPDKLVIDSITLTNATCEGFADGSAIVFSSGGQRPYLYSMDNSNYNKADSFTKLQEGTYSFSVKDSNNCIADTTLALSGYPHIIIDNAEITPVRCFGNADGSITLNVSGGVQPLTYKINSKPLSTSSIFNNLTASTYTIVITDSKNCKKDTSLLIISPERLNTTLDVIPNDCEGYDNEGMVTANVTGGTQPYSYSWSDTSNSFQIRGLRNGRYAVWITDANGCLDSAKSDVTYNNCCKIYIPNAFTPNGDGKNDKIRILLKGDFVLKEFIIYNRFGQRVFITSSVIGQTSEGWDGTFGGVPQDLGVYNYYVKGICGNAGTKEVEYKGTITLVK